MRRTRRAATFLAACIAAAASAACDGSTPPVPGGGPGSPAGAAKTAEPPALPPPPPVRDVLATPKLEYVVHGSGAQVKTGDLVAIQYTLSLAKDGTEIVTTRRLDEPSIMEVGAGYVIPGWERVVAQLRVGDRVKARIPSDLAYGDGGAWRLVPAKSDVDLDIELLEIVPPPTWEVLKTGDGVQLRPGMRAVVHHVDTLPDGTVFDSSRDRGIPEELDVGGGAIEAWEQTLPKMRVGDRWKVRSHWAHAYGAGGRPPSVPKRSDVYFDIEVLGVRTK